MFANKVIGEEDLLLDVSLVFLGISVVRYFNASSGKIVKSFLGLEILSLSLEKSSDFLEIKEFA